MIISRYLTHSVLKATFAITTVLILAFISQQTVRYLNYVAIGKVPTNIVLQLISFEVPYLLALLLPLGLYLGILLAYGRLYSDNEMAILQMCGLGNSKILRLSFIFIFVIMVVILWLMLWLNPWISNKRQQLLNSSEATLHMIETLVPGRFQVSPDGKQVLYVEKMSRNHKRAHGVFLANNTQPNQATLNQPVPWTVVFANEGYQSRRPSSKDHFFVTENGHRYEGTPGQNDYRITKFRKYEIRIPNSQVKMTHQAEEAIPSMQLWQDYQNPDRAAELQWRISMAIVGLLLGLLAVPLSARQPRKSRYLVIFPAVLFYILYLNVLLVAKHAVEQGQISITLGMWWVHGIVALLVILTYSYHLFCLRWGK